VNGLVIKAHGSSNALAITNAVKQAKLSHDKQLVNHIIKHLPSVEQPHGEEFE